LSTKQIAAANEAHKPIVDYSETQTTTQKAFCQ